jgi:hypothetical protein
MKGVLEALHQGDYDTAIERLTRKALFGRKEEAKEALLLLAEVHSLYGEEGLEKAHRALEEAYELGELEYTPSTGPYWESFWPSRGGRSGRSSPFSCPRRTLGPATTRPRPSPTWGGLRKS